MSVEPQNAVNEVEKDLLSIENDISEKIEKLYKENMHVQGEICQTSIWQGITSTLKTSSCLRTSSVKLTELSTYRNSVLR